VREGYFDERPIAAAVDGLRVLESFNACVEQWCASVPEQWREHCQEEDAQERAQRERERQRKAKETRERNYWAARGMVTA
jgi:hypothetical protein